MINYETYCKIRDHRERQGLTIIQTARALGLHPETVSKYSRREHYRSRPGVKRGSRLDQYKGLSFAGSIPIPTADNRFCSGCARPATRAA